MIIWHTLVRLVIDAGLLFLIPLIIVGWTLVGCWFGGYVYARQTFKHPIKYDANNKEALGDLKVLCIWSGLLWPAALVIIPLTWLGRRGVQTGWATARIAGGVEAKILERQQVIARLPELEKVLKETDIEIQRLQ